MNTILLYMHTRYQVFVTRSFFDDNALVTNGDYTTIFNYYIKLTRSYRWSMFSFECWNSHTIMNKFKFIYLCERIIYILELRYFSSHFMHHIQLIIQFELYCYLALKWCYLPFKLDSIPTLVHPVWGDTCNLSYAITLYGNGY